MFPVGIGLRDPRSQKRDLGHPSVSGLAATRELGAVDVGAGLAGGANHVEQLQALRVALDGLGNGIPIERYHQGYGLRRILERMLPDQIVSLVYRAV